MIHFIGQSQIAIIPFGIFQCLIIHGFMGIEQYLMRKDLFELAVPKLNMQIENV